MTKTASMKKRTRNRIETKLQQKMTTRQLETRSVVHERRGLCLCCYSLYGGVTMTTGSSKNGATTLSRMNFSVYVEHATTCIFS